MGNNVKSRLHLHKKDDRPPRDDNENAQNQNTSPPRNQVDQVIMSGPNRARAVDVNVSDSRSLPTTTQAADTTQANTTSRSRT